MNPVVSGFPSGAFEELALPDVNHEFIDERDVEEFRKALNAPESTPFVSLNDWKPIHQRIRRKGAATRGRRKKKNRRSQDETREGIVYSIFKWPLLIIVLWWIIGLGIFYWLTRLYVWAYEKLVTWRGRRQDLRRNIRSKRNYEDWKIAAKELDLHLGNERWKEIDDYAYYDAATVNKAKKQLNAGRHKAIMQQDSPSNSKEVTSELEAVVVACVKSNFVGVENPRLYSETYYGTKHLTQGFIDELQASLAYLLHSSCLSKAEKFSLARQLHTNLGRTSMFFPLLENPLLVLNHGFVTSYADLSLRFTSCSLKNMLENYYRLTAF